MASLFGQGIEGKGMRRGITTWYKDVPLAVGGKFVDVKRFPRNYVGMLDKLDKKSTMRKMFRTACNGPQPSQTITVRTNADMQPTLGPLAV